METETEKDMKENFNLVQNFLSKKDLESLNIFDQQIKNHANTFLLDEGNISGRKRKWIVFSVNNKKPSGCQFGACTNAGTVIIMTSAKMHRQLMAACRDCLDKRTCLDQQSKSKVWTQKESFLEKTSFESLPVEEQKCVPILNDGTQFHERFTAVMEEFQKKEDMLEVANGGGEVDNGRKSMEQLVDDLSLNDTAHHAKKVTAAAASTTAAAASTTAVAAATTAAAAAPTATDAAVPVDNSSNNVTVAVANGTSPEDVSIRVRVNNKKGDMIYEGNYKPADEVSALRKDVQQKDSNDSDIFWDLYLPSDNNRALNDDENLSDIAVNNEVVVVGLTVDWKMSGLENEHIKNALKNCERVYKIIAPFPRINSDRLKGMYTYVSNFVVQQGVRGNVGNTGNSTEDLSHLAELVAMYEQNMLVIVLCDDTRNEIFASFAREVSNLLNSLFHPDNKRQMSTDDSKNSKKKKEAKANEHHFNLPGGTFKCPCCKTDLVRLVKFDMVDSQSRNFEISQQVLRVKTTVPGKTTYPKDWTKHNQIHKTSKYRYITAEIDNIISRKSVDSHLKGLETSFNEDEKYLIRVWLSPIHTFVSVHLRRYGIKDQAKLATLISSPNWPNPITSPYPYVQALKNMIDHFSGLHKDDGDEVLNQKRAFGGDFSNTKGNFILTKDKALRKGPIYQTDPFDKEFYDGHKRNFIGIIYQKIIAFANNHRDSNDLNSEPSFAVALKCALFDDVMFDATRNILCKELDEIVSDDAKKAAGAIATKACESIAFMIADQVKDWCELYKTILSQNSS